MTMSSRYGIRYSWYAGLPPDSGRYRFTRNTTSRSAMSVRPRHGLPLRDLHRRVIDARRAVRAIREGLLPSLATHEAIEDAGLLPPEGFSRRGSAGIRDPLLRVLGRGEAAPLAEHEALAQAVRPEAVRAVDRDARGLADRVQAWERRLAGRVRGHPAHDVMLARTHGDRLAGWDEAP